LTDIGAGGRQRGRAYNPRRRLLGRGHSRQTLCVLGQCGQPSSSDTGYLQVLLPRWQTSPLPLHLVSPQERRQAAKVRAFSEHVVSALADCSLCN
jgi:DNA-binding transcriptional LysR family regulator